VTIALARPPLARLLRTTRGWLPIAAWAAVAVAFAVTARSGGSVRGADHVLVGGYGGLVLPLLSYAIVGALFGARSLSASIAPLVALGALPARAAAASVLLAMATTALAGLVTAAVVALVAHGSADPPLAGDALESAYAGGLGGAAYAAWFALGASFGRRGGGRALLLVADWLLGSTGSAAALLTPRAHLRNLLGGPAPMDFTQRASAAWLVAIAVACAVLSIRRAHVR